MGEAKDAAKAAKKAAKAEKKRQKKAPTESPAETPAPDPAPAPAPSTVLESGPTPAERSAAAAERQVRLQRYRVWLALITAIVAAAALIAATKPWERFLSSGPPTETSSPVDGAPES